MGTYSASHQVGLYLGGDHFDCQLLLEHLGAHFMPYFMGQDGLGDEQLGEFGSLVACFWFLGENYFLHSAIRKTAELDIPLFIVRPFNELDSFMMISRHFKHVNVLGSEEIKKVRRVRRIIERLKRLSEKKNEVREEVYKFTLRLPEHLEEKITLRAKEDGTTKARLVRRILETSLVLKRP